MGRFLIRLIVFAAVLFGAAGGVFYGLGAGWFGERRGAGEITQSARPAAYVETQKRVQAEAARSVRARDAKQILFGDFHAHTTFSSDAFLISLPVLQGEGAHPPADACDFARYCAALDFWSINDHAEGLTKFQWDETRESIRQCNAAAGDEADPDMVSFLGWEWTQVGRTPDLHYGHKNVIMRDTSDEATPARAIASRAPIGADGEVARVLTPPPVWNLSVLALASPVGARSEYLDFARFYADRRALDDCEQGVGVRDLPVDCHEAVATAGELFGKLREWDFPAIVIPHGNSWGFYSPPGTSWDKQLTSAQNDPEFQYLVEIYSGHGNSEEYRDWRAVEFDDAGRALCPLESEEYLPSCRRAGAIIESRCLGEGRSRETCLAWGEEAIERYLEGGLSGFLTVPGARLEDWLDSGQCRDCFLPSFNHRPRGSTQYALAITNFDDPGERKRFRFGFLSSSDNHQGRPGTGYKEYARHDMTEVAGVPRPGLPFDPDIVRRPAASRSIPIQEAVAGLAGFQQIEVERQGSFFMTGGLVAVHSEGRSREEIWSALERREVYGTSGGRMLLWFDLENGAEGRVPMGGETVMRDAPRFVVRAAGSLRQNPGCPDHALEAMGADRLSALCLGECYNPSDTRKKITHIDIIRILPQERAGEPVGDLIEDPWRRFECSEDEEGCVVRFRDEEFERLGRTAVYYARAVEEPTPAVNGGHLRCTYDENGVCVSVRACFTDYRTPKEDDCLEEAAERAWSSPIYIDYGRASLRRVR